VCRELTKHFEEVKRDNADNLIEYYSNKPPKGEIVVVIENLSEKNRLENE
jgi:16S rRNA (cytidine1402-2'-O)-methyltransferase